MMQLVRTALLVVTAAAALPAGAHAQRPVPLDTLHATGSRLIAGVPSVTRSLEVIDRAGIERLPARNVTDVVARVLGVDLRARSAAQADVSIRGGSFEQVLVLVDGVPVNDDQTGHFHLDLAVPLDAIERIEVLRGPASSVYGTAAVGGVVNIVTRRTARELNARTQAGSFGAIAGGVGVAHDFGSFAARASGEHDRSDGHRTGTDHRTTQARLAVDAPVAGGTATAVVAWAARDFGADAFYAPFASYEETRTATAALSWRSARSRWNLEPRVSLRRHEDDFILMRTDPSFYHNVHTTQQLAAELVARTPLSDRVQLALGAEAARSDIDSNSLGDRAENRQAAFAEVAVGDVGTTLFTAGLRADRHSTFGAFLAPSIAASHAAADWLRLRASGGAGFRAPSWTDRFYEDPANLGNPELDVERFWTAELGLRAESGAASVDAAAFVRHADDLIDWGRPQGAAETEPWQTLNVESATFSGVESTLVLRLAALELTGRAALLSFTAKEVAGYTSKYALQPLTRSGSIEAAAPLGGPARIALRVAYDRRADDSDRVTVDARVGASVRGVHVFADATNLLDEHYLDVSGMPGPGRALGVGMRLRR